MKDYKDRIEKVEKTVNDHSAKLTARELVHEMNAQIMRDFCEDNNRLREELASIKVEQATNKLALKQYGELTKELKTELRDLGEKIVVEISSIKNSLAIAKGSDNMKQWVIKHVLATASWASILIAGIKYLGTH